MVRSLISVRFGFFLGISIGQLMGDVDKIPEKRFRVAGHIYRSIKIPIFNMQI